MSSTDSEIIFYLFSNYLNNFTCYSNESSLIITNADQGSSNEVVCSNLEPATEYTYEFKFECDIYAEQNLIATSRLNLTNQVSNFK